MAPIIGTPSAGLVKYQNLNIFHGACALDIYELIESLKFGFQSFLYDKYNAFLVHVS